MIQSFPTWGWLKALEIGEMMNALKRNADLDKSPVIGGMKVVLWFVLGLVLLSVCVGLPIIYLFD